MVGVREARLNVPLRVIIRADASRQIGSGHVMRCATLAGFLRQRKADVVFVCREHSGHYCDWLEAQGYAVLRLPAPSAGEAVDRRLAHSAWLGVTQARDYSDMRQALGDRTFDWLIVDHYALDAEWETTMRPCAGRILAIDDLADRRHDADILLDQNLQSRPERYRGRLPDGCIQLLGSSYALLRPEFASCRADANPRSGELKRLLIFMGGSDPHNLTGRVLTAVKQSGLAIHIDVVMGNASIHLDDVREQCAATPDCILHVQTDNMACLMAASDLMIGAPGSATWERCCLGLPSLLVVFADNQRELGAQVARHRAAILLGHAEEVSTTTIAQMLMRLAKRPALLRALSRRGEKLVDGKGIDRVGTVLTLSSATALNVRPAQMADENMILEWANDPLVRRHAYSEEVIDTATHRAWFRKRVGSPACCRIYIVEVFDGLPIGQVRFEKKQTEWEIDYSLDWRFRGKALAKPMLKVAMLEFRREERQALVIGRVKEGNIASRRVFEGLCYKAEAVKRGQSKVEIVYRRDLRMLPLK